MEVNELTAIDPNVDFAQILPIQQKRTIAFVNNFVMNTVSFLNNFCQSCESRLLEFEYKLQKVEASLSILESQLSSIVPPENLNQSKSVNNDTAEVKTKDNLELLTVVDDEKDDANVESTVMVNDGPKASEDPRFSKFFKMVQVGVPLPAVKLKMEVEGLDPTVLDKPNEVIPDFSPHTET